MVNKRLNFWNGRNVLVTGASGLVGSWLTKDLLKQGAHITALVHDHNPQSEFFSSGDAQRVVCVNGQVEDFATLARTINQYEIDTVFHLAAQTIVGSAWRLPLDTFESNVRGTYNLLEACRVHQDLVKRIIVASSDKAYGHSARLPYHEQMPLQGRFPYEVSKSCADLIAQSYYHTYKLPVAIVRCGNIYGGGDLNWSRIVPGTITSFFKGQRPEIRSDGKYIRDYVYVKDVCRAYLSLAENLQDKKLQGQAFNYSDGSPLSVLQMVEAIQKVMDCRHIQLKILNCARGEIHDQYLSSHKARKILKWKPQFTLHQGLSETVDWYRGLLLEKNSK